MSDRYYLLRVLTGESWPVADPVAWLLEHRLDPLLHRGRERLLTLGPEDGNRIVRLVTRRCGLVLIDLVSPASVVVHHWAEPPPDIRQFMKDKGLAKHEVKVALENVKNEVVVIQPGDAFLYGRPVEPTFPWPQFEAKWQHRLVPEQDDWQGAPLTRSTLCWDRADLEGTIPWAALKCVWRRDQASPCPNCHTPLAVLRFVWCLPIYCIGLKEIIRGCFRCRQEFRENIDSDFRGWLVSHLDYELLPTQHHWGIVKADLQWRYPSRQAQADDDKADLPEKTCAGRSGEWWKESWLDG